MIKKIETLKDLSDILAGLPDKLLDKLHLGCNPECDPDTLILLSCYGEDECEKNDVFWDLLNAQPEFKILEDWIKNVIYAQKLLMKDECDDQYIYENFISSKDEYFKKYCEINNMKID